MNNDAKDRFKKQFADLLTGPTCLNNAERLTDNLFAANDPKDIAEKLFAMTEEFLLTSWNENERL